MKIKVRFFASYRERAGTSETELELPPGKTVADLLEMMQRQFPDLPESNILVAVDAEFVTLSYELHEGDEVVLIPPVSGG